MPSSPLLRSVPTDLLISLTMALASTTGGTTDSGTANGTATGRWRGAVFAASPSLLPLCCFRIGYSCTIAHEGYAVPVVSCVLGGNKYSKLKKNTHTEASEAKNRARLSTGSPSLKVISSHRRTKGRPLRSCSSIDYTIKTTSHYSIRTYQPSAEGERWTAVTAGGFRSGLTHEVAP